MILSKAVLGEVLRKLGVSINSACLNYTRVAIQQNLVCPGYSRVLSCDSFSIVR